MLELSDRSGCRSGLVSVGRLASNDRQAVLDVFEGLSEESRRLRFHGPKPRLPQRDLERLVDVGCCGREAVAAVDLLSGEVVGIARFVRDHDEPSSAEIAFEVVDRCQGSGIGSRLLRELSELARREGIERFSASVVTGNEAALALVRGLGPVVASSYDDGAYELVVEIGALAHAAQPAAKLLGVRIVAGSRKGHRIEAPKGVVTRPTGDRVREAAFALVGPIEGASVLDVFAGSGALGLEALSRGASRCAFVERDKAACRVIQRNLEKLRLTGAVVVCEDAIRALREEKAHNRRYDLVLIDAPYEDWERYQASLGELLHDLLADDGLAVVETSSRVEPELPLALVSTRRYGSARISVFSR